MPHRLAEDIEEERRVFHVALTRCRSSASIIPGSPPSPFLLELARPGKPTAPAGTPDVTATRIREVGSRPASLTRQAAAKAEMLAAAVGSRFTHRGHDHEIVALSADGVRALLGRGPAITTVAFGTPVTVEGRPAVLAHPRFAEAWDGLRTWRAKRAKAAGKPAFVVFDDKTLRLVAAILPTNEAGLLAISGIGPAKLESYGDELIAIAEQFRTS
jgi:superfamily II DNA helicase RecQ